MYRIIVTFKENPDIAYILCEVSDYDFMIDLLSCLLRQKLYHRITIKEV